MSNIDGYVERVMKHVPRAVPQRTRIEREVRAHLQESLEDSRSVVEAVSHMGPPEEVARSYLAEIDLPLAGLWRRTAAFLIDLVLGMAALIVSVGLAFLIPALLFWLFTGTGPVALDLVATIDWLSDPGTAHSAVRGVGIVVFFATVAGASLLYFPVLEHLYGQTLGKWLLDIAVVEESGLRVGMLSAVIRRLPLFFEFFPIDAAFAPFTERKQRAFDMVAKTLVVDVSGRPDGGDAGATMNALVAGLCLCLLGVAACAESRPDASRDSREAPLRILVTNDDGIESEATLALARALSREAEVFLVAPVTDHSGTSTAMPSLSRGSLTAERQEVGDGITAFAVDGPPGDCILFALGGPMRNRPPDLFVAGINGGSNLADAWVASGTIGAARAAAWLGVPAVAISGVREDDPASVDAVVDWSVRFLGSPVVRSLRASEYLTVSLPVTDPGSIGQAQIKTRARGLLDVRAGLSDAEGAAEGARGERLWTLDVALASAEAPDGSDAAVVREGGIAIVPGRAGEYDPGMATRLRERAGQLPAISPTIQ